MTQVRKILKRHFVLFNISDSSVICNKFSHICYKKKRRKITSASTIQSHFSSSLDDYHPYLKVARQQSLDRSSPSVTLAIASTSNNHSYCFVCKKPGPLLIVAQSYARFRVNIQIEIFVQSGSGCCPVHIENGRLSKDAMENIKASKGSSHLNTLSILELLQQAREEVLKRRTQDLISMTLRV